MPVGLILSQEEYDKLLLDQQTLYRWNDFMDSLDTDSSKFFELIKDNPKLGDALYILFSQHGKTTGTGTDSGTSPER